MNTESISRKHFLKAGLVTTSTMFLPNVQLFAQEKPTIPPPLKPEIVKEFVGVCHSNLARVKEMLENDYLLLHCSWDLGGGDFESGIEAAGHVGNKQIADYLLSKGARYSIFLAALYGQLGVVKTILSVQPQLLNAKGPHGLTLLHHGNKGGDNSKPVVEYLKSLGATITKYNFYDAVEN